MTYRHDKSCSYTLHCLRADGSPHPLYPPTDGWPADPLSVRRPIIIMAASVYDRGGAKQRRRTLSCSQSVAEIKGEYLALHLPEGTAEVIVRSDKGYCAHYAIDQPEGVPVMVSIPGHGEVGASVCEDRLKTGWRMLWWWDVLPGTDPDSDEGVKLASQVVCEARDKGCLPGLKTDGYRIMGANLRPGFARLLQPRVKPAAATPKKKGRRK